MKFIKVLVIIGVMGMALGGGFIHMTKEQILMSAIEDRNEQWINWMLAMGADPNTRVSRTYTPLNLAVRNGDMETINILLDHGANPNLPANYGRGQFVPVSNISLAVNHLDDPMPIIQRLIEAGADPSADAFALDEAIEQGNLELAELFIQYGGDLNRGLQTAIMSDKLDMMRLLLDYGADPDSAVHLAKITYNEDALVLLAQYGANIESVPREELYPEDYVEVDGQKFRLR